MRIISGNFKGRRLSAIKGFATRPTTDRVRESIFNILGSGIRNQSVLDLFAGTGALGLEALSRGAAHALFVDASKSAINTIQKNITACRAADRARTVCRDISRNLNCLQGQETMYDLIFMDPPYNKNLIMPTLQKLITGGLIRNATLLIIEHAGTEMIPKEVECFHLTDQRSYGKTCVSFLTTVL